MPHQPTNAPLRTALIVVAAALGLGLASAARMLAFYEHITVQDAVLSGLMDWGTWLPFVPLVFLARRRWPLSADGRLGRVLLHALFAFGLSFGQAFAFAASTAALRGSTVVAELRSATLVKLHAGVFLYFALVLGLEALDAQRRAREEATRRAEVGRRLAEARFAALEGHLRPHFLFNTLNSIAAHARREPDLAEALIAKLGGLLRRTVSDGEPEVTLASELSFVRDYLDIERARFGQRLAFELRCAPECQGALLPRLALQPLVENAVQHGIAAQVEGGRVTVLAERADGRLRVYVSNAAEPGAIDSRASWTQRELDPRSGNGFGMAAIRERLEALYGQEGSLELRTEPTGTVVELCVPYRTQAGLPPQANGRAR